MNITPDYYTAKECGKWIKWEFGEIKGLPNICSTKEETMIFRSVLDAPVSYREGQKPCVAKEVITKLHSFAIGNPMEAHRGGFARWDTYNGWTTTLEDVATMDEGR